MTVPPYIFYATGNLYSALVGTIIALILAGFRRSLITVSLVAVLGAYVTELLIR